ncbi:MAG: VOC family protein [Trueperaceae bacterium]|nr:VOC family protein [Trueperaceae bacterium]MCC6311245.1 VOC family protein [Trueperaceae bacterium]MCO5173740.1 VOC family protein [Trueperaceae bacterium]
MLKGINISNVLVLDQNEALDFYVGKLGLEVSNDVEFGFMRWLTVRVPGGSGPEILLEVPAPPSMDPETAAQVREIVTKGATGFTVGFITTDAQAMYETLKAKGVQITDEPTKRDYGTDFGIRDPFGNHIRIVQYH